MRIVYWIAHRFWSGFDPVKPSRPCRPCVNGTLLSRLDFGTFVETEGVMGFLARLFRKHPLSQAHLQPMFYVSWGLLVEKVDGRLITSIPLKGDADNTLRKSCSRAISEIDGESLRITIPIWLVETPRIEEGDWVSLFEEDGKLHIRVPGEEPRPLESKPYRGRTDFSEMS